MKNISALKVIKKMKTSQTKTYANNFSDIFFSRSLCLFRFVNYDGCLDGTAKSVNSTNKKLWFVLVITKIRWTKNSSVFHTVSIL